MLQSEGAFPRLVELIVEYDGKEGEEQLHRMLLDIMYEMSRIQRLTWEDLCKSITRHNELQTNAVRISRGQRCFRPLSLRHYRVTLQRRV
jgi:hypothetical protein